MDEDYEKQLKPLSGLKEVHVDALDNTSGANPMENSSCTVNVEGDDGNKKKRKRKTRYPKGFDPTNPGSLPDPERWLPGPREKIRGQPM